MTIMHRMWDFQAKAMSLLINDPLYEDLSPEMKERVQEGMATIEECIESLAAKTLPVFEAMLAPNKDLN